VGTVGTGAIGALPTRSKAGPLAPVALAVETADDLTLSDGTRKKELPYKVYFPRTGGPFPVILFSHGFGGSKDAFGPVGKHWASQGYVVIHPSHSDGIDRRQTESAKSVDRVADPPRRFRDVLGGQMGGGLTGFRGE
jgi:predicted dienelactone hydrolase